MEPLSKQQQPVKILVFSASLRKDSFNTQLAKLAVNVIEKNGGMVNYTRMSEFDCPSMNQDLEVTVIARFISQVFLLVGNDKFKSSKVQKFTLAFLNFFHLYPGILIMGNIR